MIPHSRPGVDDQEMAAVVQALQAGHLSQGEEVARLERDLSAMFDAAEVVAVSSGTAALYLALAALGVRPGKKVVIPSYTCPSLYAAVAHAGGTPVCADTGKDSVCIAPATVSPLLDDTLGAVIVPHMFGYLADMEGFAALGYPVIEDCAQSVGGRYADGGLAGSKGHIACFSFYGTKLLPAGEGGACVTRDQALAETIRLLRNCDERPLNPWAFNFKMGDLNAALARAKLRSLNACVEQRARLARCYDAAFGQKSFRNKSAEPQAVCFRYLVELPCEAHAKPGAARGKGKDLNSFLKQAQAAGITCRRPVWEPLHYTLGGKCPRTERLQDALVSIPLYPNLAEDEVAKICATLSKMPALR